MHKVVFMLIIYLLQSYMYNTMPNTYKIIFNDKHQRCSCCFLTELNFRTVDMRAQNSRQSDQPSKSMLINVIHFSYRIQIGRQRHIYILKVIECGNYHLEHECLTPSPMLLSLRHTYCHLEKFVVNLFEKFVFVFLDRLTYVRIRQVYETLPYVCTIF